MVIRNAFRCSKCFLVLILMSGFIFTAMGLTAPYMTGAQAIDARHISISWRNNDIATEQFIILRKTSSTLFQAVDSVPFPSTTFNDSNLAPSTQYFYAVRALAQGVVSDTSNIVSAVTAQMPEIFVSPYMTVTLNPITNIDSIAYYDGSTVEKGFLLYRMNVPGVFSLIDSQISTSPSLIGWKFFKDSNVSPNTWYTYKVEVFNNSDSLFSSDDSNYTYKEPAVSKSFTFSKISEFPIIPIGWSEKIGDSLYVVENDIKSSTAITVIDIKDRSNPAFKGYLRADSLPAILQHTKIADYIKFNVTSNPPWAPRKYFSANGFDFVFRGDTLFQYNSATQAFISSIVFNGPDRNGILAQINDSLLLLNVFVNGNLIDYEVFNRLYTCKFSNLKLDTLTNMPIGNYSEYGEDAYYFSGYQNQKAYFFSYSGSMCTGCTSYYLFHIFDYTINPLLPLHFQKNTPSYSYLNSTASLIDSFVEIRYNDNNVFSNILILETFDIRSSIWVTPLSSFTDTTFKGGAINNVILDSTAKEIFMVGANSFAIYKYSQGPAAVKMDPRSLQSKSSGPLKTQVVPNGILIKFGSQQDLIEGLSIYNVAGKIVRQFPASLCRASQGLLWDAKDGRGAALSPGPYFLVLKGAKITKSTRVFLMHR